MGGKLSPQVQFPAYRGSLRSQRKHKMSPPDLSSLREYWAWQLTLEDHRFSKSSPNSRLELNISNSTYLIQHQEMPIKSSFKSVSTYTKTKKSFSLSVSPGVVTPLAVFSSDWLLAEWIKQPACRGVWRVISLVRSGGAVVRPRLDSVLPGNSLRGPALLSLSLSHSC